MDNTHMLVHRKTNYDLIQTLLRDIYGKVSNINITWQNNVTSNGINNSEINQKILFNALNDNNTRDKRKSITKNSPMEIYVWKYTSELLQKQSLDTIKSLSDNLLFEIHIVGNSLAKQLLRRDHMLQKQTYLCEIIIKKLQTLSGPTSPESEEMKFNLPSPCTSNLPSISEASGSSNVDNTGISMTTTTTSNITNLTTSSDFNQWLHAMKMVARLPGGMPPEFRKKLWSALSDRYMQTQGIDWSKELIKCLSEHWRSDDEELGIQIVKDLHRTGSSLCSGPAGSLNQAKLKRVLLGYARWNPEVGYCQGFNMLGALILQVMDKNEAVSIQVMIFLIEGVLPPGYFCGSLGGLQADMAVFRELLTTRLPRLAKHLQKLQGPACENTFEPPLTNVFTMQWFLTLFCTCLPLSCVLRIWDLVLIEGSDVLLRTALAIWGLLEDRIVSARSADDFYCKMGVLSGELLNGNLIDSNKLVQKVVDLGPIGELQKMRDKHLYNIAPWRDKRGLKIFYSDEEGDSDDDSRLAVTTAWGLRVSRRGSLGLPNNKPTPDNRDRIALDINLLKNQYTKLRERQRQAHIILTAACARQTGNQQPTTSTLQMNQLLLGKNAILSAKGRRIGPPIGTIPPARKLASVKPQRNLTKSGKRGETLHWKDTEETKKRKDSIKWKDITPEKQDSEISFKLPDAESISEEPEPAVLEISQPSFSRSRKRSESSSYSEDSEDNSSTSTSLCDDDNIVPSGESSIEMSPMKKKITPDIQVPPQNKSEDIKNYIISLDEINDMKTENTDDINSSYHQVDEKKDDVTNSFSFLLSKNYKFDTNELISKSSNTDNAWNAEENDTNELINLNKIDYKHECNMQSDNKTTVDILLFDCDYNHTRNNGAIPKNENTQKLIKDDIKNTVSTSFSNYLIDFDNCDNIYDKSKHQDTENNIILNKNYSNEIATNQNNGKYKTTLNNSISPPNYINSDMQKINDDRFLSLSPINITSTSQLSPIADISRYINSSNISPLKTPLSIIDYSEYTTKITDLSAEKSSLQKYNKNSKNDFKVSDEGVTNEFFERLNVVERPNKLDLSDISINKNTFSNIYTFETPIKEKENSNSPENQTLSTSVTTEFSQNLAPSETEMSIIPSCTDISALVAEKSQLINQNSFELKTDVKIKSKSQSPYDEYNDNNLRFSFKEKSMSLDEPTLEREIFRPTSCPETREDNLDARRNSNRALEIMQENSLILHRILKKNITDCLEYKCEKTDNSCDDIKKYVLTEEDENDVKNVTNEIDLQLNEKIISTTILAEKEETNIENLLENKEKYENKTKQSNTYIIPNLKVSPKNDETIITNKHIHSNENNLEATLTSIENTIKSINSLCNDSDIYLKNPSSAETLKYLKTEANYIETHKKISSRKQDESECNRNYINASRNSRDLSREPSPRRRRNEELEEYKSKMQNKTSPLLDKIENVSTSRIDSTTLNKNYAVTNDSYELSEYNFGHDLNNSNIENKTQKQYLERPEIRHSTVTCTFYDRYLSHKREKTTRVDKSPSSPIITKSYLETLKPMTTTSSRITKSAENSPSRMIYNTNNIIVAPTSPIFTNIDDYNIRNKYYSLNDYQVKSCDNIPNHLNQQYNTQNKKTVEYSNSNLKTNYLPSYSPLPIKLKKPSDVAIKLGLYKSPKKTTHTE